MPLKVGDKVKVDVKSIKDGMDIGFAEWLKENKTKVFTVGWVGDEVIGDYKITLEEDITYGFREYELKKVRKK